jgi:restriction system protein
LPSGRQTTFANRVHWAKSYLKQAGLLEATKRGYFRMSERGKQVLASNPVRIDTDFLLQFAEFQEFRQRHRETDADSVEQPATAEALPATQRTPDEVMRAANAQINRSLAQDLLDRILGAPPEFFERLIVNLLRDGIRRVGRKSWPRYRALR